jgi:hypothetical protein
MLRNLKENAKDRYEKAGLRSENNMPQEKKNN